LTASRYGYALFDTAVGRCGVAWGDHGVVALQLPEVNDGETVARLTERLPDASDSTPPVFVQQAIDKIVALLDGEPSDLSTIELDMTAVPPFHRRVYQLARTIPAGETLSYGAVAARLGSPGAARAVGQALRRNPFAIVVPCHRVVGAGGKLGGFSANGGLGTKVQLLSLEAPPPPAADQAVDGRLAGKHLRAADPVLADLMDAVGPLDLQLTGAPTTFAALARAIVYQQLNGRSAGAIYGRLCALFPGTGATLQPGDILAATDEQLLGAGLSRAKLLAIRDLARRAADGAIPTLVEARAMEDEAIVEELSEVRGIGRWSAEMFLIFTLGRPDVLPVGDFSVRKGFGRWFRNGAMPTPKELLVYGERWRPYRSVASWYLWRAAALQEELPVSPAMPG
jgi:methylated-DNA-[protein]-cysteine S-methyltransferase